MAGKDDYRSMLADVAGEITDEDAKDLAQNLNISRAARLKISNGRQLIQEMERTKFVSRDNVDGLLDLLERKSFTVAAEIVEKYKQTLNNDDSSPKLSETAPQRPCSDNSPEKKKVDSKYFEELSEELEDDWKVVGRKLGLKNPELSNIEKDNQNNRKEAIYQMFCKWLKKNGSAATYEKLATAFEEAGMGELAEAVLKYAADH